MNKLSQYPENGSHFYSDQIFFRSDKQMYPYEITKNFTARIQFQFVEPQRCYVMYSLFRVDL